jgi:hypothetical protein
MSVFYTIDEYVYPLIVAFALAEDGAWQIAFSTFTTLAKAFALTTGDETIVFRHSIQITPLNRQLVIDDTVTRC